jgi:hypothetical protein
MEMKLIEFLLPIFIGVLGNVNIVEKFFIVDI